jgi:hypothetical protein
VIPGTEIARIAFYPVSMALEQQIQHLEEQLAKLLGKQNQQKDNWQLAQRTREVREGEPRHRIPWCSDSSHFRWGRCCRSARDLRQVTRIDAVA